MNDVALTEAAYSRLLMRQGRVADAKRRLAAALEILQRLGTSVEPDRVQAELAELPVTLESAD
ncbi:MAG TPA: hypothetical protein VMS64_31360 [Candidatus Methylomirabilis sp.]|nr:hypothetical protein [Candidatus Methylomirabilis sp.]